MKKFIRRVDKKIFKLCRSFDSLCEKHIIDRENKSELKKLREVMERLEGEPSGIIDI